MGIINATPDSFYTNSTIQTIGAALALAEKHLSEGAIILDVGGQSTKPNAIKINAKEEALRVVPVIKAIAKKFGGVFISVDTFYADVAKQALDEGASMVNDISAGSLDANLLPLVANYKCPYVLMHMKGTPSTMQHNPFYKRVVEEVYDFFKQKISECKELGIEQILLDVGFGFGKTIEHNYSLLKCQAIFLELGFPLLTGLSRKSMINKVLQINAQEALNGTTALHMLALQNGASILRVHDVAEAKQVIDLWQVYTKAP